MLAQYFCWIHPPKISVFVGAVLNLVDIVKVLLVLCIFEEVDVLILFEGEDEESSIVAAFDQRYGNQPDEWHHERGWFQQLRQLSIAYLFGSLNSVQHISNVVQSYLIQSGQFLALNDWLA